MSIVVGGGGGSGSVVEYHFYGGMGKWLVVYVGDYARNHHCVELSRECV